MDFYTMLSDYYDDIFHTKHKAVACIQEEIPCRNRTRLLDLAAGTGAEALALARDGYDMTATDTNPVMVKTMKAKADKASIRLNVKLQNMMELSYTESNSFDGIYCIGNSFVHLPGTGEMVKVLNAVYNALKPGGAFIIQIVNYDRVFSERITALPVIKNAAKGLTFERFYDLSMPDVTFRMVLTKNKGEGEADTYHNKTKLHALTKADFNALAEESFFHSWRIYGDFQKNIFSEKSPALVAVLKKA